MCFDSRFFNILGFGLGVIALGHVAFTPVFAQDSGRGTLSKSAKQLQTRKSDLPQKPTARIDYVDADKFITKITSLAEPKPRGEFETREAYEARQAKLTDSGAVLVRLEHGYKDYAYDIDSKTLSIQIPISEINPRKRLQGVPLRAAYSIDKKEQYTASNAYGARVTVERTWSTQYLLFVPTAQLEGLLTVADDPAMASLPESMRARMADRFKKKTVTVSLTAEPSDAERIAKDYIALLLVRPRGLQGTVSEATFSSKATINEPKESTLFTQAIEIDLIEIVIRDGKTGKTLLRKAVFDAMPPPISESSANAPSEPSKKQE